MTKIYVFTHRAYGFPPDPMYIPLQVGAALHDPLPYARDDTGDNISTKNPFYSELTGLYWVYMHEKAADILGTAHYRRYLLDEKDRLFTEAAIAETLKKCDVISTKQVELPASYYEAFGADHNRADLDHTEAVINELCPSYADTFRRIVSGNHTYFGNMFIARRSLFNAYCAWLFPILEAVEERVDMTGYNAYQKRLFGFLSELLQTVYFEENNFTVHHCMVGMSGEKQETIDLKKALAGYFSAGDIAGAKACFLRALDRRPDILMEASDIYGDLIAAMQVISTAEYEADAGLLPLIRPGCDFYELTGKIRRLNALVTASTAENRTAGGAASAAGNGTAGGAAASAGNGAAGSYEEALAAYRQKEGLSDIALSIAEQVATASARRFVEKDAVHVVE